MSLCSRLALGVVLCLLAVLPALAAPAPTPRAGLSADLPVQISVTTKGPNGPVPVADAYVGLVPRDQPMRRPSHETVTESGSVAITAAPGAYMLITAAPGFETDTRRIMVSRRHESVAVDLFPEFKIDGTVTDAEGHPLAGARVAHVNVVAPPSFGSTSALAQKSFGARFRTRTDANGSWRLAVSSSKKMPLFVDAPGYAPAVVVYDPAGQDKNHLDVTLQKGASLTATLDRVDPAVAIVAIPKSQNDQSVPLQFQRQVWGRVAASASIAWDSLPPGDYRIAATVPDPLRFGQPAELATVTLKAGQSAHLDLKVPPAPLRRTAYVAFLLPENAPLAELRAFVRDKAGAMHEVARAEENAVGGEVVYVADTTTPANALVTTKTDVYLASHPGLLGLHRAMAASETERLARAAGSMGINAPEGTTVPAAGTVTISDCAHNEQIALPLGAANNGKLAVPLLAPCHVATLQYDGFSPLLLTVAVEPGQQKFLGNYTLSAAASAEIHVVRQTSLSEASGAIVQVLVKRAPNKNLIVVAEQTADEKGRLLMKNVPAGVDVTFQARDAKTQLTGTTTLRLAPAQRAIIDPLTVPESSSLTLVPGLDPEFKGQYPSAAITAVKLYREGGAHGDELNATVSKDKPDATFYAIAPGRWDVQAFLTIDGMMQSPFASDPIEVVSGEEKRVEVKIKPMVFTGQAISQGHGIPAKVTISDQPSLTEIGRQIATDTDGTFKVILPKPGIYDVKVQKLDKDARSADLGPVLFDPSSPNVRLELPEGSLVVHVLNGGQPVASAAVTLTKHVDNPDASGVSVVTAWAKTVAGGVATLDPLEEGMWEIEATVPHDGGVARKSVSVSRSARAEITLDTNENALFAGNVLDASSAPSGRAGVECVFVADGLLLSAHAEANVDGRFSMQLPKPMPESLQCGATTVDGTIQAFHVAPNDNAQLLMPAATSSLTISDWGQKIIPDRFWLVGGDGSVFDLSWAARKIGKFGAPLVIPHLPAGRWRVVRVDSTAQLLALGQSTLPSLATVAEVTLQPGQSTTIRIQSDTAIAGR